MPEAPTSTRLTPQRAWRAVSDAPLLGMALAREANLLLTWDQALAVCLYDGDGKRIRETRVPAPLLSARISDDGSRIALLIGGPRLMVLDNDLKPISDRPAITGATTLDIDPHAHFIVVATRQSDCQLYAFHGKPIGKFETKQPLSHVRFVPSIPMIVGASGYGTLVGVAIEPTAPGANLRAEVMWEERLLSNLGRLETTGDGSMILASCYNLGIQRYDIEGQNEGSYHCGGTALHAVPDFPGRLIAVATQEGELALLNRAGVVRWKDALGRPPVALELDALGRFLIYGLETGEICRLDIQKPESRSGGKPRAAASTATRGETLRASAWSEIIASTEEEGQGAVLALLDDPPRLASITRTNRLQVFDLEGNSVFAAPEIVGVGRILRTSPGWIASATDRKIQLYNALENTNTRVEIDLHELTHLIIRPSQYGLAIVQERDRLGRATPAGRWVWKRELKSPIEDLAIGPMNLTAITCDDGSLRIFDAAGEPAGRFQSEPAESLLLVEGPNLQLAPSVLWVTLARRAQVLRGHAADGRVIWESPTPWEGWQLWGVPPSIVVLAPDGRSLAFDVQGYLQAQAGAESAPFVLAPSASGLPVRLIRRGDHLICAQLDGQVIWRAVTDETLGPVVGASSGVAAIIGRALHWFPNRT